MINIYSVHPTKIVSLWPGTGFKNCNEKWVEKVSAMCVILLYISFIIKCEYEWVNNDKILITYEVPELIRKLHKKLLTEMWQQSNVRNVAAIKCDRNVAAI